MNTDAPLQVWVIDRQADDATLERLGDARPVADRLGSAVGVLLVGPPAADAERLIHHGADRVHCVTLSPSEASTLVPGVNTLVAAARQIIEPHRPRLILVSGDPHGREWAAALAVAGGFKLISPVLLFSGRGDVVEATILGGQDGMARRVRLDSNDVAVATLRPGVGEALPADPSRRGVAETSTFAPLPESADVERVIPADPASVDIRFARRLVSGGRGLGGKEGFDLLRRFAAKLDAGVAASRMAVDLGWIGHERQVGQTGRTVAPDLYIACGISGASHHLEGMSAAKHIVAINTDPEAPIFKPAHLGLVADLKEVLRHAKEALSK